MSSPVGGPERVPGPRAKALQLTAVAALAAGAAWLLWPRPALEPEVDARGLGHVVGRWGRRALPDTLYVDGGRHAEVRLVNRSARPQQLGIFGVGAGETRSYRVGGPGVFGGVCTAHPTGRLLVYVVR